MAVAPIGPLAIIRSAILVARYFTRCAGNATAQLESVVQRYYNYIRPHPLGHGGPTQTAHSFASVDGLAMDADIGRTWMLTLVTLARRDPPADPGGAGVLVLRPLLARREDPAAEFGITGRTEV
jgi:hypothetical protein